MIEDVEVVALTFRGALDALDSTFTEEGEIIEDIAEIEDEATEINDMVDDNRDVAKRFTDTFQLCLLVSEHTDMS